MDEATGGRPSIQPPCLIASAWGENPSISESASLIQCHQSQKVRLQSQGICQGQRSQGHKKGKWRDAILELLERAEERARRDEAWEERLLNSSSDASTQLFPTLSLAKADHCRHLAPVPLPQAQVTKTGVTSNIRVNGHKTAGGFKFRIYGVMEIESRALRLINTWYVDTFFKFAVKRNLTVNHVIIPPIPGLCIGPSFCDHYRQHCLVETPKTWLDAQSHCRERGFDLATIDNMGAMIALHPLEWHWSLADNHFYKEGERNYRNFKSAPNSGDAVVTSKDGMWSSTWNRSKLRVPMCYDGKEYTATANKQGRDRYVRVLQAMPLKAAREYCRSHHTDLVSIRNPAENQVVQEEADGHEVWIGLFRDTWRWSDGRYSSFRFWNPDQLFSVGKNIYCGAVIKETGRWDRVLCTTMMPFLCTCTKTRVFRVKVHSEDLQDLNDPATKAAILKQIQQLVEDATSTNAHKITWRTHPDGQVFTREQCHQGDCDSSPGRMDNIYNSWWKMRRRPTHIRSHGEHILMDRSSPGSSVIKETVTLLLDEWTICTIIDEADDELMTNWFN
ncbi:Aggrecan core protein [Merluccius polli]|uniref:Aggrecan core protein n=1 Tax=Merluccius polli TaxID=89951 RepID=A0AA47M3T4_MERPO|nr:Aggrecan core protein [Merluccius polli]